MHTYTQKFFNIHFKTVLSMSRSRKWSLSFTFPTARISAIYMAIQEESSIFWKVRGHCEKNNSYAHVCNSEWLPRWRYLNLQTKLC